MINISYDLHIHSCLSPCGDDDMTPANIVGMASLKELDVIALTDHNSAKNCPAFLKFAEEYGILAIPGMELTTEEEVHVVCLFAELSDALDFDAYVYEHLQAVPNQEDIFGKQQLINEQDEIIGTIPNLLINATTIRFDEVYGLVERFHGIMIPAHIDKSSNSLISNLGFIPPDSCFAVVELKNMKRLHELRKQHPYLEGCNIITNSDAHYLEHINEAVNTIQVEEKSRKAVLNALTRQSLF